LQGERKGKESWPEKQGELGKEQIRHLAFIKLAFIKLLIARRLIPDQSGQTDETVKKQTGLVNHKPDRTNRTRTI